uniref:Uncharacterized protein n=2 Tax=Zea mays TaxID=4577 RepID=B6UEH9_MAIZE|nr:hypothetical protein [Zea mays]
MATRRTRSAAPAMLLLLVCAMAVSAASAAAGAGRGRVGSGRAGPSPCQDLATRDDCAARAGCRWCRSEALDDMCFGPTEARRLPRQVFSCDPPSDAAHASFNK